jgi:hypothetical protein
MSLIKSFVHAVMEIVEDINQIPEKDREIVKQGASNLANAYVTDIFRAADFLVNITKGLSREAVMKIVMPSSFEAIKKTSEELKTSEDQKIDEAMKSQAYPHEKPGFTLNPKPWATSRPNPYIPTPTPCSPSARD